MEVSLSCPTSIITPTASRNKYEKWAFPKGQLIPLVKMLERGANITAKSVDLIYDNFQRLRTIHRLQSVNGVLSGGGDTTNLYNSFNRVTANFLNVGARHYFYDADGRLTFNQSQEGVLGPDIHYAYDAAGWLTGSTQGESYTYDANGNRLTSGATSLTYGAGNQLLSDGTYNYVYDKNGNLTKRTEIATGNSREFQYDFRNRLTGVTDKNAAGTVLTTDGYTYDALDRRIQKVVGANSATPAVTDYVYDGNNVRLEFTANSIASPAVLSVRYFNGLGIDNEYAEEHFNNGAIAPGQTFWAYKNNIGSTVELYDAGAGAFANHFIYDSFGNLIGSDRPAQTTHLFAGREFDAELGEYFNRARHYDSLTGRFTQEDPTGVAVGQYNPFEYALNNPLAFTDPMGLEPTGGSCKIWKKPKGNFNWEPGDPITPLNLPDVKNWAIAFADANSEGLTPEEKESLRNAMTHGLAAAGLANEGVPFAATMGLGVGVEIGELVRNIAGFSYYGFENTVSGYWDPSLSGLAQQYAGQLRESLSFDTVRDIANDRAGSLIGAQYAGNSNAIVNSLANGWASGSNGIIQIGGAGPAALQIITPRLP